MATSFEEDSPSSLEDDAAGGTEPKIMLSSSPMPITALSIDLTSSRKATPVRYKKSVKAPINPSNPSKNAVRLSAYRRRWIHAFPESLSIASGVFFFGKTKSKTNNNKLSHSHFISL